MRAYQVWTTLPGPLNHEIWQSVYLQDKKLYRLAVQDMAEALRKRPQALLELPREARHELFRPLMGLPQFDVLGHNLVIKWLGSTRQAMLVDFLDALGIPHDGNGCAEQFPETMTVARLKKAIAALYAKHDAPAVSLYLHLFPSICGVNWPGLADHIQP